VWPSGTPALLARYFLNIKEVVTDKSLVARCQFEKKNSLDALDALDEKAL